MDGMTRSLTDYADDVWNGAADDNIAQSGSGGSGVLDVADGVGFHPGFGNVITFKAGGELVLFDSGNPMGAPGPALGHPAVEPGPGEHRVFTHGHIDHVFGVDLYEEEARTTAGPAAGRRARARRRPLRSLPDHRRLQRA